ncbi:MAG TPA: MFS transporter [Vicinamibacterales bacterium]|nr:MFS transporter [Vicinamibacterales bacterium]
MTPVGASAIATRLPWRAGHRRWEICALLFFAAAINYIDRQVIGILKPTLQAEFGWSEIDYGDIVFAFQLAYAIGFVFAGRLMDRLGTRVGFSLAIVLWSLAAIAHAEATFFGPAVAAALALAGLSYSASVAGFMAARFALGLGESGNFPAAIKTVAEWFPKEERALATGIFNAGTNVGALITPLVVPWITITYGWYWAFVATGAIGFAWLLGWWWRYDEPERHARLGERELAYIRAGRSEPATPLSWARLLPHRQTWAFAIAKFMTDPIWWLYLFWIPDFLNRAHGVDLSAVGLPLVTIYLVADLGSVGGGWLSSSLIKRGWSVNAGRKTAMLVCALAVTPIVFAAGIESLWGAVALVSLAAAAHQGWSANVYTLVSDTFPRRAVGSLVGFGGMAGAVGGMLIAKLTAVILEISGSYVPVFFIAGVTYLLALGIVHALMPSLAPVRIDDEPSAR